MNVGLSIDPIVLGASLMLVLAVVVASFSKRLQAPSALLFLGIGMVVGDDVLGLVTFSDERAVQNIGVLALVIILFEGGLTTKPTDLRRAAGPGGLLATLGVLITASLAGLGAWLLLDVEPLTAALLGAVVSSTDAAAVFSTLRSVRLPPRLAAILKVESGANDPFAIVLTLGLLEVAGGESTAGGLTVFALLQPLVGVVVGVIIGVVAVRVLRAVRLPADGLYPVLALAFAGVAYGLAVQFRGSGFLAVYVAGLLVGAFVRRRRRGIRDFHEGLANAAEIGLFLILGLLVFPSRLVDVITPGVLLAALLIVVARPVATALCLTPFRVPWREQIVVGWGGLRGAVPIVLATFPITAGFPGAATVFDVVFFVVLLSTLVQGSTVGRMVGWLGIQGGRPAWAPVAEALPIDEIEADLVEVIVSRDLPITGRSLREAPLPEGMLLAAIVRSERVIVPRGDAVLLDEDVLLIVVQDPERAAERVTVWARSEGPTGPVSVPWPRVPGRGERLRHARRDRVRDAARDAVRDGERDRRRDAEADEQPEPPRTGTASEGDEGSDPRSDGRSDRS